MLCTPWHTRYIKTLKNVAVIKISRIAMAYSRLQWVLICCVPFEKRRLLACKAIRYERVVVAQLKIEEEAFYLCCKCSTPRTLFCALLCSQSFWPFFFSFLFSSSCIYSRYDSIKMAMLMDTTIFININDKERNTITYKLALGKKRNYFT